MHTGQLGYTCTEQLYNLYSCSKALTYPKPKLSSPLHCYGRHDWTFILEKNHSIFRIDRINLLNSAVGCICVFSFFFLKRLYTLFFSCYTTTYN